MIILNWEFKKEYGAWEVMIPAQDHQGNGDYCITLVPRPVY